MDVLLEEKVLVTFNQLVSEGSIVYGPYETIKEDCEGYPVSQFNFSPDSPLTTHAVGIPHLPLTGQKAAHRWRQTRPIIRQEPKMGARQRHALHGRAAENRKTQRHP